MGWNASSGGRQRVLNTLMALVLVVMVLYFGREILIPLALALLFTFLLSPLVTRLERWRVPRPLAVLIVMASIAVVAGFTAWLVGKQFMQLAVELDTYKANLKEKISSLRFSGSALAKAQETLGDVSGAVEQASDEVMPVRVIPEEVVPFDKLSILASTVLTPLANAAIIVVLVLFMLIYREDVRNRIVRLAGKRMALTTKTLDEIGYRISRYLLASAIINGGFGIAVAAGLWFIGLHYAVMWGFLAGVLRFVPYVGPTIGAAMPITMAFIQFPGHDWIRPAEVAGLFVVLELITNNIAEPLLYGQSAGVSTVSLLISVAFWTWVWGPMGLLLAVPLTVVMAVLGDQVPMLKPLGILLGDKPPLAPHAAYYQRLLAHDDLEAGTILEAEKRSGGLLRLYDDVLLPALVMAENDSLNGHIPESDRTFIWEATEEFVAKAKEETEEPPEDGPRLTAHVLACPVRSQADVLPLVMLDQVLPQSDRQFETVPVSLLASEIVARVKQESPDAVLISSIGGSTTQQTRYICKRLRTAFPSLRILVGRWGYPGDRQRLISSLKRRGADHVFTSLAEARDVLVRLQPLSRRESAPATEAAGV